MAARTKRTATQLPGLPPELWDYIFEFATYVPYTLAPEIFEKSYLIGSIYHQEYRPKLRAALITKRYLVRVCKWWWHIAIRHLYRAIYVGRARSLPSLCNTLQMYATGKGAVTGAGPLGQWTQRLDVAIRDRNNGVDVHAESYAILIGCLPNLAIVSITTPDVVFSRALPSILRALRYSASSICVLDWTMESLQPDPYELFELLRSLPRLHTFHFRDLYWEMKSFPASILSSLNTLALSFVPKLEKNENDSDGTCISLREVVFDALWNPYSWKDFMSSYGIFITSAHILAGRYAHNLNDYLAMINRQCPNVLQMTIFVDRFSSLSFIDAIFPPVEYLGLIARKFQESRIGYQRLFSNLAILKARVPRLRVVQLVNRHNVQCLLTRHSQVVVHALEHELAGGTLRVVDHEGNLLSDKLMTM